MYRFRGGNLECLLVHPGGPFWRQRDAGAWSIPKGEIAPDEPVLEAAQREFEEETGVKPTGPFVTLTPIRQRGGKLVHAWAFEGDCDPRHLRSNTFELEWPPRSGKVQSFPEIDRAEFYSLEEAALKINPAQRELITELSHLVTG